MAGSIKRGQLNLKDGLFDVAEAVYDIFPSDKGNKTLGVKEFCCKRTGPFLNDSQEYVGDAAPDGVAHAQNAIIFRLITHPAFAEPGNIRKMTEIAQRRFNRVDGSTDRPLLDVFMPSQCFLWAQRNQAGDRLTDQQGRSMVRGVQLGPELVRMSGDLFPGPYVRPDNKMLGDWKGFTCISELNSRFGEDNVLMMKRTLLYVLPESMWGVWDTDPRLHSLEDRLMTSMKKGRYESVFVILVSTKNTNAYPVGMRYKVHCRPTAFGMYDIVCILQLFDGIKDLSGDSPTADMVRSIAYLTCISQDSSGIPIHDPHLYCYGGFSPQNQPRTGARVRVSGDARNEK